MKTCRDCGIEKPDDDFYAHWSYRTYDHRASYCKVCHRRRAAESTYKARAEKRISVPREPDEAYLNRHLQKREHEAEWGARYLPVQAEPENLNDPEPVFRDMFYQFQRPQTKVSFWKTA